MIIKKQNVKIFFIILLMGLFLNFNFFVKQAFAARQDGESCNPDSNDCAAGLICKYPSSGGATAYCGKGVANAGKLADGLMCDNPSQCLGGYCEKYSGDSTSRVCGNHASPYSTPTTPTIKANNDKFTYTLLESFPGFFTADKEAPDLPTMILAIYKFGIWTIGIAALFMITIGGAMYMMSAGNSSKATTAKDVITDSLIGIVAAMSAYLLLYVINPDLTRIDISFTKTNVDQFSAEQAKITGFNGTCSPVANSSSACSVENLKKTGFSSVAESASRVCSVESNGIKNAPSGYDKCFDNTVFSWGLFQINLTQHSIGGYNCPDAFNNSRGLNKNVDGKYTCSLKTDDASKLLYKNCVAAASDPNININFAVGLFNGNRGKAWQDWSNTRDITCRSQGITL